MREFEPALADDQRSSIRETVHNGARQARVVESSPRPFRALRGDATTVPTDELLQGCRRESIRFRPRNASCCG
jgi:hypothetical protein